MQVMCLNNNLKRLICFAFATYGKLQNNIVKLKSKKLRKIYNNFSVLCAIVISRSCIC